MSHSMLSSRSVSTPGHSCFNPRKGLPPHARKHLTSSLCNLDCNFPFHHPLHTRRGTRYYGDLHNAKCSTLAATTTKSDALLESVSVQINDIQQACLLSLQKIGYTEQDAELISEVVLYAQLRGNPQGIVKIPSGALNIHPNAEPPSVELETPSSALINGQLSEGMLVLAKAVDVAVEKAARTGIATVGTYNTSTSTGAIGYWARQLAEAGCVGIVLSQTAEYVAPHGSTERLYGTNPIAVGIPTQTGPLVVDMATSAVTVYELMQAAAAGRSVSEDVGYDVQGEATTNPQAILDDGALRGFDRSHKSSHLALIVELLAGALVGGAVVDKAGSANWGNLILALHPSLFGSPEAFQERAQLLLDRVKAARRAPGVEQIFLPGERGDRVAAKNLEQGTVQLPAQLWQDLQEMASRARPATPEFPQEAPPEPSSAPPESSDLKSAWRPATQLLHPDKVDPDPLLSVAPVLYQTATFGQPSATQGGPYDYTRSGNPTRAQLEAQMASLEGADRAFAFTSGMAALAAVCRLVRAGEHILAGNDIYGGTSRLLAQVVPDMGIRVSNVEMSDLAAVAEALIPGETKLVLLETPTNPRMQICDIRAIADLAHKAGALVVVDNSIMVLQQPVLQLGADISMTSATKFIGGHSDLTGGILSVKGPELARRIYFYQNAEGSGLGPFDCWLALRGLKTMALRMERQAAAAGAMAAWLARHPLVRRVNYPGLPGHPDAALHWRQARSAGSLLSFETGSTEASRIVCDDTQLFNVVVSFGSVASSISMPCYMSHASIPAETRAARGLPDDLVRISAGIEDVRDLIADLDQALRKAMAAVGMPHTGIPPIPDAMPSEREAFLLQRIERLEAKLKTSEAHGSNES